MHADRLAHLPFGNHSAISDARIESLRQTLSAAVPGDFDIRALGGQEGFRHRTTVVQAGALSIAATATTPVSVRRREVPYPTLRIPISGYCSYSFAGGRCIEQAGRRAVLLSGAPRTAETGGAYASAHIVLDPARLAITAQAIAGSEKSIDRNTLSLDRDREIDLQAGAISYDAVFRAHFALLDACSAQPTAPAMLAIDDLIYRSIVMLLIPSQLLNFEHGTASTSASARLVEALCNQIEARLDEPLTLTELERISGLSRRALQYAFLRHCECTPMQWLRERRLDRARHLLTRADASTTVTNVALCCGFPGSGPFSRHYNARFGETPSATLTRRRRGRL